MDVYVDSDVVISSLLSRTGAAYHLLNYSTITLIISSTSLTEIKKREIKSEDKDKDSTDNHPGFCLPGAYGDVLFKKSM